MARQRKWVALALGIVVVFVAGAGVIAFQPRVANHFGYALPGKDGLPTYIFENGRRYVSAQVCAGADWCKQQQTARGTPSCYTQADLQNKYQQWPLVRVDTLFTLFGSPHDILTRAGDRGLTTPYVIANGTDCYIMYSLDGGP